MRPLCRRGFLKQAAKGAVGCGVTAVSATPSSLHAFYQNDRPIRVGVIIEPTGAHLDAFLSSLADCEGIEEIAVADSTGETFEKTKNLLAKRFGSIRTFRDDREMIASLKPQLALVSLEAHHAPEPIERALNAGCHVLSEKPACVRQQDFEKLTEIARSRQRHLMLALANRLTPPVKKAKELVQSGLLGKLYGANLYFVADQTRLKQLKYQQSWRAYKGKMGGGHLIWLGIHWLDLVQLISGDRVREVCGFSRNVGGQPIEVEDAAVLALQFDSGMVGTMQSAYYLDRGYHSDITLWGSSGWLRFDLVAGTPLEWYSTHPEAPRGIQSFSYTLESREYFPMVQASVNCARGIEEPWITGSEGLHLLKVIFGLYRAAETGKTQTVV
jgi:predicted dehydrogenase